MKRKITSGLMLTLLAIGMLTLAFNIQTVKASGTIYIRADGSVEGTTHITSVDNVTYTLTGNINDSIVVERDNIVVDGAGYTLQGTGSTTGINLSYRTNVTIKNMEINYFYDGIYLSSSASNNIVSGNNITNNDTGIFLSGASNNSISGNNITANNVYGIRLLGSSNNNSISGNNITNNDLGISLSESSNNNIIYHNNFVDNTEQHSQDSTINTWDNGYPSGGNYWSDYNGADSNGDGLGDTPYIIDANNQDNYPLMSPWTPPEHELIVSITAPALLQPGNSSALNAIVTNLGLNDEVDVELSLLINGTMVDSTTIAFLKVGNSHTLSYLWTPTVEGTYNVTVYVPPLPEERNKENNQMTKFVTVAVSSTQVGVNAGDWIKYDYTITGAPSGTPLPTWIKIEFLSVEETTATTRVTMHMSDGTEQSDTVNVDVATGSGTFQGLSGFVIPANYTTGDSIYMSGVGNVTLDGETTGTYAGASRTVVYASFSQYGTELIYYWDKETGVMVEAFTTSGGMTGTAKATETNMWEATTSPFWMQWWFIAIVAVVIVALAGAAYFLKKRRQPTPIAPAPPAEGTETSVD